MWAVGVYHISRQVIMCREVIFRQAHTLHKFSHETSFSYNIRMNGGDVTYYVERTQGDESKFDPKWLRSLE